MDMHECLFKLDRCSYYHLIVVVDTSVLRDNDAI